MEWNMQRNMEWNMEQHIYKLIKLAVQSVHNQHKHYRSAKCHKAPNKETVTVQQCVQAIYGYPFFLQLIALRVFTARYIICMWTDCDLQYMYMYIAYKSNLHCTCI